MDFRWVKAPKNKAEEKEQFDKLYHMLVQLSKKSGEDLPSVTPAVPVAPSVPSVPADEFTRLRMDLLANFKGQAGLGIPALVTCTGCHRSFYSEAEREKHFRTTPACQEWARRGLVWKAEQDIPFFSWMELGIHTLLSPSTKECRFCQKPIANRRAHEKHLLQTPICNRLAHHTFQSWFLATPVTATVSAPVLALPAPAETP